MFELKARLFLLVYFDFEFIQFLSLNFRSKLQPEMVQMAILKRAKLLSTTTRNFAEKKLNVFLPISISKTLVKCQLTFLMVPMATKVFAGIYHFQILLFAQLYFLFRFKLVRNCSNLYKIVQTCLKL